jgi:hypothetical protein
MNIEPSEANEIFHFWKIEKLQELILEEDILWESLVGGDKEENMSQVYFDLLLILKENRDKQLRLLWGHKPPNTNP